MEYKASSIEILEGLDPVKKRPGMYIGGGNNEGFHHLLWEIVDNCVDEVLANFCDYIEITINEDNSVTVFDNGRGIPVDKHPKTNKSALETIFTVLHSGGKFNNNVYKVSGGLHGVGASVVNALSLELIADVYLNNFQYTISFKDGGNKISPLTKKPQTEIKSGTRIQFFPDYQYFDDDVGFDLILIETKLKQIAFLNPKLQIHFYDFRNHNKYHRKFYYENGIVDYLQELIKKEDLLINGDQDNENLKDATKISQPSIMKNPFFISKKWEDIILDVGFEYGHDFNNHIFSFCNNIYTPNNGSHFDGVKHCLLKAINDYNTKFLNQKFNFVWEDIIQGLNLIISLKHPNPQYEGQTKKKLSSKNAKSIIIKNLTSCIYDYLCENPKEAKKIFEKINVSYKARVAALNAREIVINKEKQKIMTLPGKLADCQSKDPKETELYIVEGDSAGGSAKLGRNRKIQAILPLRGKVINAEKTTQNKVFANNEIKSIITALGTNVLAAFDYSKLRYHKIIIMTDADVDGSHIRILLLTFFYHYFQNLILNKNIYIACPPLFKIKIKQKEKYFYDEKSLKVFLEKLPKNSKYNLQRYKGLGEMNPSQLWSTTMDPDHRLLKVVEINDAYIAAEIFKDLMGIEIQARKKFINNNAHFVKNLTI